LGGAEFDQGDAMLHRLAVQFGREAGRRLDAQQAAVGCGGVVAGLGGQPGDGGKVAGVLGCGGLGCCQPAARGQGPGRLSCKLNRSWLESLMMRDVSVLGLRLEEALRVETA
jgi:hypothetical protein